MRIEVELPDIIEDYGDEVTISSWFVEEDDEVEEGETIVELAADENTINITAPASGRLVEIVAKEGDVVRVGDILAVMETMEEKEEEF
ncbi:MAG TPA: biotin/lipoyl-containing protein [Candidatus Hypogeohydataceae bacterium YC41]